MDKREKLSIFKKKMASMFSKHEVRFIMKFRQFSKYRLIQEIVTF